MSNQFPDLPAPQKPLDTPSRAPDNSGTSDPFADVRMLSAQGNDHSKSTTKPTDTNQTAIDEMQKLIQVFDRLSPWDGSIPQSDDEMGGFNLHSPVKQASLLSTKLAECYPQPPQPPRPLPDDIKQAFDDVIKRADSQTFTHDFEFYIDELNSNGQLSDKIKSQLDTQLAMEKNAPLITRVVAASSIAKYGDSHDTDQVIKYLQEAGKLNQSPDTEMKLLQPVGGILADVATKLAQSVTNQGTFTDSLKQQFQKVIDLSGSRCPELEKLANQYQQKVEQQTTPEIIITQNALCNAINNIQNKDVRQDATNKFLKMNSATSDDEYAQSRQDLLKLDKSLSAPLAAYEKQLSTNKDTLIQSNKLNMAVETEHQAQALTKTLCCGLYAQSLVHNGDIEEAKKLIPQVYSWSKQIDAASVHAQGSDTGLTADLANLAAICKINPDGTPIDSSNNQTTTNNQTSSNLNALELKAKEAFAHGGLKEAQPYYEQLRKEIDVPHDPAKSQKAIDTYLTLLQGTNAVNAKGSADNTTITLQDALTGTGEHTIKLDGHTLTADEKTLLHQGVYLEEMKLAAPVEFHYTYAEALRTDPHFYADAEKNFQAAIDASKYLKPNQMVAENKILLAETDPSYSPEAKTFFQKFLSEMQSKVELPITVREAAASFYLGLPGKYPDKIQNPPNKVFKPEQALVLLDDCVKLYATPAFGNQNILNDTNVNPDLIGLRNFALQNVPAVLRAQEQDLDKQWKGVAGDTAATLAAATAFGITMAASEKIPALRFMLKDGEALGLSNAGKGIAALTTLSAATAARHVVSKDDNFGTSLLQGVKDTGELAGFTVGPELLGQTKLSAFAKLSDADALKRLPFQTAEELQQAAKEANVNLANEFPQLAKLSPKTNLLRAAQNGPLGLQGDRAASLILTFAPRKAIADLLPNFEKQGANTVGDLQELARKNTAIAKVLDSTGFMKVDPKMTMQEFCNNGLLYSSKAKDISSALNSLNSAVENPNPLRQFIGGTWPVRTAVRLSPNMARNSNEWFGQQLRGAVDWRTVNIQKASIDRIEALLARTRFISTAAGSAVAIPGNYEQMKADGVPITWGQTLTGAGVASYLQAPFAGRMTPVPLILNYGIGSFFNGADAVHTYLQRKGIEETINHMNDPITNLPYTTDQQNNGK